MLKETAISYDAWTALTEQFQTVRKLSEDYCAPLAPEDYGLQAMAETSPAKWHLAHTSWFFETFVLKAFVADYQAVHPQFEYLFNSYYNGIGDQFPRAQRGLLSRPTVDEIYQYRAAIDDAVLALLGRGVDAQPDLVRQRIILGLHHELQHQELFFTDLKYNFFRNPLFPVYQEYPGRWLSTTSATALTWVDFEGGISQFGTHADPEKLAFEHFCFDNESPQHRRFIEAFRLASRPVCNADYLEFIEDGGYQTPSLWLSDGWAQVQTQGWRHPLYWLETDHGWQEFTLHGLQALDPARSVCHLSAYEADAYARWVGARLPTEFEWEFAAGRQRFEGHGLQGHYLQGHFAAQTEWHPGVANATSGLSQLFGSVWEWTSSSYSAYPGFHPAAGAVGEYNGKFMCNQLVLRGGSCVTDHRQMRSTYRNFFYPPDRWQFSGLRLAKNGERL